MVTIKSSNVLEVVVALPYWGAVGVDVIPLLQWVEGVGVQNDELLLLLQREMKIIQHDCNAGTVSNEVILFISQGLFNRPYLSIAN